MTWTQLKAQLDQTGITGITPDAVRELFTLLAAGPDALTSREEVIGSVLVCRAVMTHLKQIGHVHRPSTTSIKPPRGASWNETAIENCSHPICRALRSFVDQEGNS